jgi:hypothetical protein
MPKGDKFFVRGADGSLHVISKDKATKKLSAAEKAAVEQILLDTETELEAKLHAGVPSLGSMVNVSIATEFPA